LNPELPVTTGRIKVDSEKTGTSKKYKSVPANWKAISENNFRRVIADLEMVLFDISADGVGINTPDGKISASTLNRWAEHLRNALETLSKGQ